MALANRAYDPIYYDLQFGRGVAAAREGGPREPRDEHGFCFWYGFSASAWFDGYDSVASNLSRKTFNITLKCRQQGAIGIFSSRTFQVNAHPDLDPIRDRERFFKLWYEKYGQEWEPSHIEVIS